MTKPQLERQLRIAAFAGSTRRGSFNQGALDHIASVAEAAGADVDMIHLGDFDIPLYDPNFEASEGIPQPVVALYERIVATDVVIILSPEYNGGYTPLFKNTIDWVSRIEKFVFYPRLVAVGAMSPGGTGAAKSLAQMIDVFNHIQVQTFEPLSLGTAREKFDADGVLVDEAERSRLADWTQRLVAAGLVFAVDPPVPPT